MNTTKPRILCVDDEPEILKFLKTLLVRNGYEVTQAEDGEQALEKLKERQIDLIISDVMMPKMNGFELCRRIKGDEQYRHIPVILITGLTAKDDRIKGIDVGAEDFISKPIDPAEVLARIKMLLKVKDFHERRIGELLIEMGFITEEQLQEALKIAKERNLKVGEALHTMGVLDKDRLYWVLSTQLKMNYIELSHEIIDKELIKEFSTETLEELLCLPLYETPEEIHFAIADPTDQGIVKRVISLKPEKAVQLHLALPEKIIDILRYVEKEVDTGRQPYKIIQPKDEPVLTPHGKIVAPHHLPGRDAFWSEFVKFLLSMGEGDAYWFYKTAHEWRILSQKGKRFETVRRFPEEIYPLIKGRLIPAEGIPTLGRKAYLVIQERATRKQGVFKWDELDCLDREMIQVERIPEFSSEKLIRSHPQAPGLINDLKGLFNRYHRLLIGAEDSVFIKECCYALLEEDVHLSNFPPPFFVESQMETYFPGVAQLSRYQLHRINLLDRFEEETLPFLFCETASLDETLDHQALAKILAGSYKNVIIHLPFPSVETMEKALSGDQRWQRKGFKALFLFQNEWKSVREEPSHAKT